MATTPHGYPYPVGTDRVMDGDDVIHALATAVDTQLGAAASGQATVPITAASTAVSVSVTYPAGRFTAAPTPLVTVALTSPGIASVSTSNASQTGFTIWGIRTTGSAAFNANWSAIQQ